MQVHRKKKEEKSIFSCIYHQKSVSLQREMNDP